MIFMCTYQIDRDKQADTQAFFANMTEEEIAGEYPDGVKQVGRWHDVPNGNGWIVNTAYLSSGGGYLSDGYKLGELFKKYHCKMHFSSLKTQS